MNFVRNLLIDYLINYAKKNGIILQDKKISNIRLKNCEVNNCTFVSTEISHATFGNSGISNSIFNTCDFVDILASKNNLLRMDFSSSDFYKCNISNNKIEECGISNNKIEKCNAVALKCSNAIFDSSVFDKCSFNFSDISGITGCRKLKLPIHVYNTQKDILKLTFNYIDSLIDASGGIKTGDVDKDVKLTLELNSLIGLLLKAKKDLRE